MNREDIIRMAREVSDKDKVDPYLNEFVVLTPEELERFATLVAAAEREACAKFIEHDYVRQFERPWRDDLSAAIRARSKQCG
jgi:hypothetical protein